MIPSTDILEPEAAEAGVQPTKTYALDWERGRIRGDVDKIEAMKQAIYLILSTERYAYPVYSWDYGVEFSELYGKPLGYLLPELKRRITEALMQDDRITGVSDFSFETQRGKVSVRFTAQTVFGEMKLEKEVDIHV